jgi:hypothetical protein
MEQLSYSRAVIQLCEFAIATEERNPRIWTAHQVGVPKAEIARLTGLSWATVDRVVREMAGPGGESAGEVAGDE